jgi:hypothetical protein
MGWLSFNLADYRSTQHYYDEARTAAHDAENTELVTYILCTMSHLATWQGRPRVGIDHAAAAAVWAEQSGSSAAQGYAADVAVRAYLADGQRAKCESILDLEYGKVVAQADRSPASWWYFYDESFYWCTRTQFALKFGESEAAIEAIDKSLGLVDPANLHERAHRSLFRAEALVQQEHIGEAARLISEVAGITAINSSGRVEQRIGGLRQSLTPWQETKPIRELDEVLAAYGEISIGNGR